MIRALMRKGMGQIFLDTFMIVWHAIVYDGGIDLIKIIIFIFYPSIA